MYTEFAQLYDELMSDVPYEKWADYYEEIFKKFNQKPNLLLDLGCGTGTMTSLLAHRGYDMIGVDFSDSMLNIAKEKSPDNVLYLCQEMDSFELYGTVDAIISSLDCVNYILDEDALFNMFKSAENYLNYGGLFIFDINTPYKLKEILGKNTYVYETDDIFYTWESEFIKEENLCDFYLNFFKQTENGVYERIEEQQTERAWSIKELKSLIKKSGLNLLGVFDELSFNKPAKKSSRVFFVAQKRCEK